MNMNKATPNIIRNAFASTRPAQSEKVPVAAQHPQGELPCEEVEANPVRCNWREEMQDPTRIKIAWTRRHGDLAGARLVAAVPWIELIRDSTPPWAMSRFSWLERGTFQRALLRNSVWLGQCLAGCCQRNKPNSFVRTTVR